VVRPVFRILAMLVVLAIVIVSAVGCKKQGAGKGAVGPATSKATVDDKGRVAAGAKAGLQGPPPPPGVKAGGGGK